MYNPIKTIKSVYRNYDPDTGAVVLAVGGAVVGGLAGVALPLYVGWEIGEYVKNALEFGAVVGTTIKAIGAVGLTSVVGGTTVPIGIIGGGTTGGAIGVTIRKTKESLEKLVSKK